MSMEQDPQTLEIFEYGGNGRSGKGTIVANIAETYSGVAVEETGADYRAITRQLLLNGHLEVEMGQDHVTSVVQDLNQDELIEMVANRNSLVSEHGLNSLYLPDVNELVSSVSPISAVRKAVKEGFRKRVETVRDSGLYQVLLVDGRNLDTVVKSIPGTHLRLRNFVSCLPVEAARRECLRQGLKPNDPSWKKTYESAYDSINKRNQDDANRPNDKVIPDPDAVNYWWNNEAMHLSSRLPKLHTGHLFEGDYDDSKTFLSWMMDIKHHKKRLRHGVGSIACRDNKQILFETDVYYGHFDDPKSAMLQAARTMFEEALGMRPDTDMLAKRIDKVPIIELKESVV